LFLGRDENPGNIILAGPIAPPSVSTLLLRTLGAVVDGTGGEEPDLIVTNLAFRVTEGIGGADDINIGVTNLAFNCARNAVNITNAGPLTINAVSGFGFDTRNNGTSTRVATTGASGPLTLTFAANVTCARDATFIAGEINDNLACNDD